MLLEASVAVLDVKPVENRILEMTEIGDYLRMENAVHSASLEAV